MFFFSSRRRHTRYIGDWSSDVCSSDLNFAKKDTSELGELASRLMNLQVNIQGGDVMVSVDDSIVYVTPVKWKSVDHSA